MLFSYLTPAPAHHAALAAAGVMLTGVAGKAREAADRW